MLVMAEVHLDTQKVKNLCDWCGRTIVGDPTPVKIVTQRGVFHDEICEPCAKAFKPALP